MLIPWNARCPSKGGRAHTVKRKDDEPGSQNDEKLDQLHQERNLPYRVARLRKELPFHIAIAACSMVFCACALTDSVNAQRGLEILQKKEAEIRVSRRPMSQKYMRLQSIFQTKVLTNLWERL